MIFKNPLLLFIIPLYIAVFFYLKRRFSETSFLFPSGAIVSSLKGSFRLALSKNIYMLRMLSVILIVTALSRPQITEEKKIRKEGIGIVLAIDASSTMLAEDIQLSQTGLDRLVKRAHESKKRLNRLDAVKDVAGNFIEKRPYDRIGIVVFAADAYMVCPLTFDRNWLRTSLSRIKVGMIMDGTAIGSGILSSLKLLKELNSGSKVIILLSDGINNAGQTPPLVAAKAARSLGVKIYTIGILSKGQTPYPKKDMYGKTVYENVRIDINEDVLRQIADMTNARYFRATDMKSLEESYREIDKLEKIEIEETVYAQHKDIFRIFLMPALILIFLEIVMNNTFLRTIP